MPSSLTSPKQDPPATTTPTTGSTNYHGHPDSHLRRHRSSQLFFGICDMRTAVVALDVLNIGFTILVVVALTIMYMIQGGPFVKSNIVNAFIAGAITVGISGIGCYGAMNFQLKALYIATIGFVLVLIWRIIHLDWIDILVNALLLYPHIILTMEMRNGIMTAETFEREEYLTETGQEFVEMAHGYLSSPKNKSANQQ